MLGPAHMIPVGRTTALFLVLAAMGAGTLATASDLERDLRDLQNRALRCAGLFRPAGAYRAPHPFIADSNAFQEHARIRGSYQPHFTAPPSRDFPDAPPLVIPSQSFAPPLVYYSNAPGEEHRFFAPRYLARMLETPAPTPLGSGGFRDVFTYEGYEGFVFKLHRLGNGHGYEKSLPVIVQEMAMDRGLGSFLGQTMTTAQVYAPLESLGDLPFKLRWALRTNGLTPEILRKRFGITIHRRVAGRPLMEHIKAHLAHHRIDPRSVATIADLRLPSDVMAFLTEMRWLNNIAVNMLAEGGYPRGRAFKISRYDNVAAAVFNYVYGLERLLRDGSALYYYDIAIDLSPALSNVLVTEEQSTGAYALHLVDF